MVDYLALFERHLSRQKYMLVLSIVGSLVIIFPIGLPQTISSITWDTYNVLTSLPKGSVIVHYMANNDAFYDRWRSGYAVLFNWMWSLGLKVIHFPSSEANVAMIRDQMTLWDKRMVYGTDYMLYSFVTGTLPMAAFAANMRIYDTDVFDNKIADMPIFKGIYTLADTCYVVMPSYIGYTTGDATVQYWAVPYDKRIIGVGVFPTISAYYGKWVIACIDATRGFAELEGILGKPGEELIAQDIRTVSMGVIMGLMVVMKILQIATKRSEIKEVVRPV